MVYIFNSIEFSAKATITPCQSFKLIYMGISENINSLRVFLKIPVMKNRKKEFEIIFLIGIWFFKKTIN